MQSFKRLNVRFNDSLCSLKYKFTAIRNQRFPQTEPTVTSRDLNKLDYLAYLSKNRKRQAPPSSLTLKYTSKNNNSPARCAPYRPFGIAPLSTGNVLTGRGSCLRHFRFHPCVSPVCGNLARNCTRRKKNLKLEPAPKTVPGLITKGLITVLHFIYIPNGLRAPPTAVPDSFRQPIASDLVQSSP